MSLGHLMGTMRLKMDQKAKYLFTNKGMEVFFSHKGTLGYNEAPPTFFLHLPFVLGCQLFV